MIGGANRWTNFVKEWAAKNGVTYSCAVSIPECKEEYYKMYPKTTKAKKSAKKGKEAPLSSVVESIVPIKKDESEKPKGKKKPALIIEEDDEEDKTVEKLIKEKAEKREKAKKTIAKAVTKYAKAKKAKKEVKKKPALIIEESSDEEEYIIPKKKVAVPKKKAPLVIEEDEEEYIIPKKKAEKKENIEMKIEEKEEHIDFPKTEAESVTFIRKELKPLSKFANLYDVGKFYYDWYELFESKNILNKKQLELLRSKIDSRAVTTNLDGSLGTTVLGDYTDWQLRAVIRATEKNPILQEYLKDETKVYGDINFILAILYAGEVSGTSKLTSPTMKIIIDEKSKAFTLYKKELAENRAAYLAQKKEKEKHIPATDIFKVGTQVEVGVSLIDPSKVQLKTAKSEYKFKKGVVLGYIKKDGKPHRIVVRFYDDDIIDPKTRKQIKETDVAIPKRDKDNDYKLDESSIRIDKNPYTFAELGKKKVSSSAVKELPVEEIKAALIKQAQTATPLLISPEAAHQPLVNPAPASAVKAAEKAAEKVKIDTQPLPSSVQVGYSMLDEHINKINIQDLKQAKYKKIKPFIYIGDDLGKLLENDSTIQRTVSRLTYGTPFYNSKVDPRKILMYLYDLELVGKVKDKDSKVLTALKEAKGHYKNMAERGEAPPDEEEGAGWSGGMEGEDDVEDADPEDFLEIDGNLLGKADIIADINTQVNTLVNFLNNSAQIHNYSDETFASINEDVIELLQELRSLYSRANNMTAQQFWDAAVPLANDWSRIANTILRQNRVQRNPDLGHSDTEGSGFPSRKELKKDYGAFLGHLTEHITDPNEPVDPRDYKQSIHIINRIREMKGGVRREDDEEQRRLHEAYQQQQRAKRDARNARARERQQLAIEAAAEANERTLAEIARLQRLRDEQFAREHAAWERRYVRPISQEELETAQDILSAPANYFANQANADAIRQNARDVVLGNEIYTSRALPEEDFAILEEHFGAGLEGGAGCVGKVCRSMRRGLVNAFTDPYDQFPELGVRPLNRHAAERYDREVRELRRQAAEAEEDAIHRANRLRIHPDEAIPERIEDASRYIHRAYELPVASAEYTRPARPVSPAMATAKVVPYGKARVRARQIEGGAALYGKEPVPSWVGRGGLFGGMTDEEADAEVARITANMPPIGTPVVRPPVAPVIDDAAFANVSSLLGKRLRRSPQDGKKKK